ncbi:MAG: hypothetical protein H6732_13575 [Alphaproteobacteria bacterium]|nr:hypothetical protein [Alphaproteobacteria bacterium]
MTPWLALLLAGVVEAQEGEPAASVEEDAARPARRRPDVAFDWGGHVKAFAVASLPFPIDGLPDDLVHDLLNPLPTAPSGQGFLDGRLHLGLTVDWMKLEGAHAITTFLDADAGTDRANKAVVDALTGPDGLAALAQLAELSDAFGGSADGGFALPSSGGGLVGTGVGLRAPEAFPLTWWAWDDPVGDLRVQGRTDRLALTLSPEGMTLTVGRQPISFGTGTFFTPLDLVNPFSPATIDTEYKPGVDAVRVDAFFGFATKLTVVAAYVGEGYLHEPTPQGTPTVARVSAAAYGQTLVGVTDLGLFYAANRGDHVFGGSVVSSIGPVGIHGDLTVTLPRPDLDEDVFVRAVVGIDGRPTNTTSLSGEVYVQSFGARDSSRLFEVLGSERARRGEVWLGGPAYAALAVSQEITPLIQGSLAVIANLTDPSFLLTPSVGWNVSNNVSASFGGYVGLGARPVGRELVLADLPEAPGAEDLSVVTPKSEFGTYPAALFVRLAAYF